MAGTGSGLQLVGSLPVHPSSPDICRPSRTSSTRREPRSFPTRRRQPWPPRGGIRGEANDPELLVPLPLGEGEAEGVVMFSQQKPWKYSVRLCGFSPRSGRTWRSAHHAGWPVQWLPRVLRAARPMRVSFPVSSRVVCRLHPLRQLQVSAQWTRTVCARTRPRKCLSRPTPALARTSTGWSQESLECPDSQPRGGRLGGACGAARTVHRHPAGSNR